MLGAVLLRAGTLSRPFLVDVRVPLDELVVVWVLTGTSLPPWFVQVTVAEYVASSVATALAWPTPASSYVEQVTVVPLSVQPIEPVCR